MIKVRTRKIWSSRRRERASKRGSHDCQVFLVVSGIRVEPNEIPESECQYSGRPPHVGVARRNRKKQAAGKPLDFARGNPHYRLARLAGVSTTGQPGRAAARTDKNVCRTLLEGVAAGVDDGLGGGRGI